MGGLLLFGDCKVSFHKIWKQKPYWTIREAAFLLSGQEPTNDKEVTPTVQIVIDKLLTYTSRDEDGCPLLNGHYGAAQFYGSWSVSGDENGPLVSSNVGDHEGFDPNVYFEIARQNNWDITCFEPLNFIEQRHVNRKGFTTPLLEVIDKSIEKYWLSYDPDNIPLQKQISADLLEQYKDIVKSKKMAECIAQIICPITQKRVGRIKSRTK